MATRKVRESAQDGSGKLYYSISEVAELLNVKAHVLRYWETQFKTLRPRKNRAGNRSYRVKDVKIALRIKKLLYEEGFTIAGARRKLLDERRSGGGQTELDFVGISREELLRMLKQDVTELLAVLRGEMPIEVLSRREETTGTGGRRKGLFRDLEFATGAEADTTEEETAFEEEGEVTADSGDEPLPVAIGRESEETSADEESSGPEPAGDPATAETSRKGQETG